MHRTLRIGLSMRVVTAAGYAERRDAISQEWAQLIENWDAIPVLLPNTLSNIDALLELVDLVILTGGNDVTVDPQGQPLAESEDAARERDLQEYRIIDLCIARGVPLLGVCRGMQLINYCYGGSLERVDKQRHVAARHDVVFAKSRFDDFLNGASSVNSFHNFGITTATLASGLDVLASASDQVVEAFAHTVDPVVGIMWHPERNEVFAEMDKRLVMEMVNQNTSEIK